MEFLHSAMWHVALESWQWIHQVATYDTWLWDDMPLNSLKRPPYWNSTSGFDFNHITAVNMSFCTSLRNFIQIGPPSAEKMTSCRISRWRISAILDFSGPIMGSLKSPCTTSYRLPIDTIALNCSVFEEIAFFAFWVASGCLINRGLHKFRPHMGRRNAWRDRPTCDDRTEVCVWGVVKFPHSP